MVGTVIDVKCSPRRYPTRQTCTTNYRRRILKRYRPGFETISLWHYLKVLPLEAFERLETWRYIGKSPTAAQRNWRKVRPSSATIGELDRLLVRYSSADEDAARAIEARSKILSLKTSPIRLAFEENALKLTQGDRPPSVQKWSSVPGCETSLATLVTRWRVVGNRVWFLVSFQSKTCLTWPTVHQRFIVLNPHWAFHLV